MAPSWLTFRSGRSGKASASEPELSTDSLGITVWAEPSPSTLIAFDIVFVHGLTGKSAATWTSNGQAGLWPANILAAEFPSARIMGYGYDADVLRLSGPASQNSLRDHAQSFVVSLSNVRTSNASRPIVFVAHSLGGLLCEQALLVCSSSPEEYKRRIARNVRGIIFFGTPHSGSGWVALAEGLSSLASLSIIKKPNKQLLQVLSRKSDTLVALQSDFAQLNRVRQNERREDTPEILLFCFHEELPVKGLGHVIVGRESARYPGYCEEASIHADHMAMTKFPNEHEDGFKAVCGILTRWSETWTMAASNADAIVPPAELPSRVMMAEISGHSHGNSLQSTASAPWPSNTNQRSSTSSWQNQRPSPSDREGRIYRYPNRMANYSPRAELINKIYERLKGRNDFIPPTVVLSGMGGYGKTQLALDFCSQCELGKYAQVILWFNALSKQSLEQSFEGYWRLLKLDGQIVENATDRLEAMLENVAAWDFRWLFIFDNYDRPEILPDIRNYIPRNRNGAVLVTSRRKGLSRTGVVIDIPPMTIESCLKILLDQTFFTGERTRAMETAAARVAERLGRLPLALDQARAYISARSLSFDEFLDHFERRKKMVLSELPDDWEYRAFGTGAGNQPLSVFTTWQLSFDCVNDSHGGAKSKKALLSMITFLDFKNVSEELFNTKIDKSLLSHHSKHAIPTDLAPFIIRGNWDSGALEDVFLELSKLSLLQNYGRAPGYHFRRLTVHPLVCDWLQLCRTDVELQLCYEQAFQLVVGCCLAHLEKTNTNTHSSIGLSSAGETDARKHLAALRSVNASFQQDVANQESHKQEVEDVDRKMEAHRFNRLQQQRDNMYEWLASKGPEGSCNSTVNSLEVVVRTSNVREWRESLHGFFRSAKYQSWLSGQKRFLCFDGPICSGKTVLAASAFETIKKDPGNWVVGLSYPSCSTSASLRVSQDGIVGGILEQLYRLRTLDGSGPQSLEDIITDLYNAKKSLMTKDLIRAVQLIEAENKRAFILIDGLDRLSLESQNLLLDTLQVCGEATNVRLMITTRPLGYPLIDLWERELLNLRVQDLVGYISVHAQKIRRKYALGRAIGEYVLAALRAPNESRAARQMTLTEMQYAIAVVSSSPKARYLHHSYHPEMRSAKVDEDQFKQISKPEMATPALILNATSGFVRVDEGANVIEFIHEFLESEYDARLLNHVEVNDNEFVTKACLIYLNDDQYWNPDEYGNGESAQTVEIPPFLAYAASFWVYDPLRFNSLPKHFQVAAAKLLLCQKKIIAIMHIAQRGGYSGLLDTEIPPDCPPIHVAAALGLIKVIQILAHHGCDFKGTSSHGNTALDLTTSILDRLREQGYTSDQRLSRWRIALSDCKIFLKGAEQDGHLEILDVEIPDTLILPVMGRGWLRRTMSARSLLRI